MAGALRAGLGVATAALVVGLAVWLLPFLRADLLDDGGRA